MDELLFDRVKQLQEIDERLAKILQTPNGIWDWESSKRELQRLRNDIGFMILAAERAHDAF